jgi:hypothetical protein
MSTRFASGKKALGVCDVCGFTYLLRNLKNVVVKGRDTNIKACPECWDTDHPQLKQGMFKVDDPQSLRDPRPDTNQLASSRAINQPVSGLAVATFVGRVTIDIS